MEDIKPVSNVDFGELMLEVAKNARYIDVSLQREIVKFLQVQSMPTVVLKQKSE